LSPVWFGRNGAVHEPSELGPRAVNEAPPAVRRPSGRHQKRVLDKHHRQTGTEMTGHGDRGT
jgi:hypothetical protein